MTPERWRQVTEVFHAALARDLSARAGYLDRACAGDRPLREEVEAMLTAHAVPGDVSVATAPHLASGTMIGPYRVANLIGAGGMGEVYRARDTKLGRDVAIKVLPAAFTDADRLARFEREARLLAALNHPHIGAIYGVEEAEGTRALILELVEGETLADRLERGPIPLQEALPIATQVADALAAAHEQGIIHRDLKPTNIKVRPDGTVKVLDFGLAKAMEPVSGPSPAASRSLTIMTPAVTHAGLILGTAAYMSPEQARGKKVDHRADIWAFGVVLYEMTTGQKLFQGEQLTDVIAAVVKEEPDLRTVPREVRKVLEACLQKDSTKRLQAIGDWKLLLAEGRSEDMLQTESRATKTPWLATLAAVLALVGLAFVHFRQEPPLERVVQLSVPLPANNSNVGYLDLSPDGRRLLVSAIGTGRLQIYLRSLDSPEWTPLLDTTGARTPFWSPDNRLIGFFADGSLKVIPAAGGPAEVLCRETGLGRGGTWNRDGVILFSRDNGKLWRVEATGGECRRVGNDDPTHSAALPMFLPDGKHFFYVGATVGDEAATGVYLATLDDFPGRKVLADNSSVVYAPPAETGGAAHLLFRRESALMAQPFDERSLQPVGDPFKVTEQGSGTFTTPQVAASAATDGTLVYLAGRPTESQLTWYDRNGKELGKVGPRGNQLGVALSPDGNAIAIGHLDGNRAAVSLWLQDLVRGSESRLMLPGPAGTAAAWSPDSTGILFRMTGSGGPGFYRKDIRGGAPELVEKHDPAATTKVVSDWSRDGQVLIYTQNDPKTNADIWYVPLVAGKPSGQQVKFLGTTALESQGQMSPDGNWLAYASNESGTFEVYIRSFPTGDRVWRVSAEGGSEPRWRADGRELFFRAGPVGQLPILAVAVAPDGRGGLRTGRPQRLFAAPSLLAVPQSNAFAYSPHPDGQRFLVNALTDVREPTLNVVTNWQKAAAGWK